MNDSRALILRLRHDSPTREMALEAADLIEELSRAQRRLPHAETVVLPIKITCSADQKTIGASMIDAEQLP